MTRTILVVGIVTLIARSSAEAQTSAHEPTVIELQKQLDEIRLQLAQMQSLLSELEAARGTPEPSTSPDPVVPQRETPQPASTHFKGLTLTPGGFLESTVLVRTRNENADMANSYTTSPLDGSSNARLSEFRGTVRNSEFSFLVQGSTGGSTLKSYVETDFLGAAPTANYLESSSWTPRLRQLWVQFEGTSGWTFTLGQMWSLLTTNQHGIATLAELRPVGEDGNYVAGFTWTREKAIRVTRNFNDKVWAAFAIEDPESTYAAAFVPENIMGLNTSPNAATGVNLLPFLSNYSNGQATTLVPDLLAKVALERGWGHLEFKAVGRLFRDRIASTATSSGQTNITTGYGLGFGALVPAGKKIEFSMEGLIGRGIGRYASSGLPDVTLDPTSGAMLPLHQGSIMGGIVYHGSSRLDVYAYGGDVYTGRYAFVSPTGAPAGYGSPLVDYSGCTTELALNACNGANRNIYDATAGFWYRLYQGDFGRIEQGNQVVYMHRDLWSGVGSAPTGNDVVFYTTFRFYLF